MKKENSTGNKTQIGIYILAAVLLIAAACTVYFVVKSNNDRDQADVPIEGTSEDEAIAGDAAQLEESLERAIEKASAVIKAREENSEDVAVEYVVREKVGRENKYDIVQFNVNYGISGWVEFWYRETGEEELLEAFGGHEAPICGNFNGNQKLIEAFQDDFCYSNEAEDTTSFYEYFKETGQEYNKHKSGSTDIVEPRLP